MLEKLPEAIGHALEGERAGFGKLLINAVEPVRKPSAIELRSAAFVADGTLPQRCTADGDGVSPPLIWRNVPREAASLVIIVEDADSPTPEPLVHAIVVDIDPAASGLTEGEFSGPAASGPERLGRNSYLTRGWLPPDPPPGHGLHHYVFQIFALAAGQPLSSAPGRTEIAAAVHDRAIGAGRLVGTYQRERPVRSTELQAAAVSDQPALIAPVEPA